MAAILCFNTPIGAPAIFVYNASATWGEDENPMRGRGGGGGRVIVLDIYVAASAR